MWRVVQISGTSEAYWLFIQEINEQEERNGQTSFIVNTTVPLSRLIVRLPQFVTREAATTAPVEIWPGKPTK